MMSIQKGRTEIVASQNIKFSRLSDTSEPPFFLSQAANMLPIKGGQGPSELKPTCSPHPPLNARLEMGATCTRAYPGFGRSLPGVPAGSLLVWWPGFGWVGLSPTG